MWIDSHCHLNHARFDGADPATLVKEAKDNGVDGMLSICCRISDEFPALIKIVQSHDTVWCSIGTHPHDASDPAEQGVSLSDIITATKDPKVIGIGESGLDYYYTYSTPQDQKTSFIKHVQACQKTGLPLIVHARDADKDIADILTQEYKNHPFTGVLHCFSAGADLAKAALDIGFYISFSGIVTFNKSNDLQDIAKIIPQDRILIETDAPFLAPAPHRGKINKPEYVHHTGTFLSGLRNVQPQDFAKQTSKNFFTLFNKAKAE